MSAKIGLHITVHTGVGREWQITCLKNTRVAHIVALYFVPGKAQIPEVAQSISMKKPHGPYRRKTGDYTEIASFCVKMKASCLAFVMHQRFATYGNITTR